MSGQWEVVGRKKDKGSKLPVPSKGNKPQVLKKNNAFDGVNISEILAKSQVQNLYNSNKNKENKKEQNKVNHKETSNKAEVKNKPKKVEKPEVPKAKPPKSIESALNSISVEEFTALYGHVKSQFPDGQIVWLKELSQFLNQMIPVEVPDPTFPNKPTTYPYSVVPSQLKSVIQKSVKEVGTNIASVFFNIALTTMATEMSKGSSSIGHKIYLQYIATSDPNLFNNGINSSATTLLNSYRNRPNIGLSILWAVGQNGLNNINSGLKVFKDLMLPLIEMKNYARFIAKYLLDLLKTANETTNLSKEEYLLILDAIYPNRKNFPSDIKLELQKKAVTLKDLLFKSNNESYRNNFNVIFKKLLSLDNKAYQNCLCEVLAIIINREQTVLVNVWDGLYKSNLQASAVLLNFIGDHWAFLNNNSRKALVHFLKELQLTNEKLEQKKKKDDGLRECTAAIKKIHQKMTSQKKSGSSIKALLFMLILLISTTIYFDVTYHGSWKESRLNKLLKSSGVCDASHVVYNKGKEGVLWVDARIEENFPGYQKTVAEYSEPYRRMFSNLGLVVYNAAVDVKNYAAVKVPEIVKTIDSYAPGIVEQSQKAVSNVWSSSVLYFNRSVDYLKKEVFVGQLSPENMQRVVLEAFNTTQQKATEYYHWIYEKCRQALNEANNYILGFFIIN